MGDSSYSSCESCSDDDLSADSLDSHPFYCQPSPTPAYANIDNGERSGFDLFDCAPPVQVQIPFTINIDMPINLTLPPSEFPTTHQNSNADASFSSHNSCDDCSSTDDDSREGVLDEFENLSADQENFVNEDNSVSSSDLFHDDDFSTDSKVCNVLKSSPDPPPNPSVDDFLDDSSVSDASPAQIDSTIFHTGDQYSDSAQKIDLPMIVKYRQTHFSSITFNLEIPDNLSKLPTTTFIIVDFNPLFDLEDIELWRGMMKRYTGRRFSYGYRNNKLFLIAGEIFLMLSIIPKQVNI